VRWSRRADHNVAGSYREGSEFCRTQPNCWTKKRSETISSAEIFAVLFARCCGAGRWCDLSIRKIISLSFWMRKV